MFLVGFVCLFVLWKDYVKISAWISSKAGGRRGNGPRNNHLNFGAGPDKCVDPRKLI